MVCVLACTTAEEKTSVEASEDSTKEDLSPQASSRSKCNFIAQNTEH
jgi:hypothetical protein